MADNIMVMKEKSIHTISCDDAYNEVMPMLYGKVFHVTKENNWGNIREAGKLTPDPPKGKFEKTFGTNSYFRGIGCVSLFDYRKHTEGGFKDNYEKCLPLQPLNNECPIIILFLSQAYYKHLVPWDVSKNDLNGKNIVPHVEVGFKGDMLLDYFDEIFSITTDEQGGGFRSILSRIAAALEEKG